ncbi:Protein transport protein sec20 [Gnomoniopsis sp. IMI 355080]|nr:Protein transport protein sec20 [Gnomoniopsis sp. IMI 355080]
MSFDALQERLITLQETTSQVKDLIDRLAKLDFQPGSVPLPQGGDAEDDENVATELSAEISQTLREEEEELELLEEEATDLRGGKEGSDSARRKERLLEGVKRLDGELKGCRIAFHKAQLSARDSLAAARRLERQLLLQSYTRAASTPSRSGANSPVPSLGPRRRHTTRGRNNNNNDDPVVAASSDLTQSLHRAAQLVQEELARSMTLHETLEEDTANLKTLDSTYTRVGGMLSNSGQLLGVLMKSTKSDTWYLETTFWMLVAVLGWLVFRRFLYGPLWWIVWLPLRIVFKTGSGAVGMFGGKEGARMEIVDGSGKKVEVDMGSQGTVPTAKVGAKEERVTEGDPESLVEKVGQIVEMGEDRDTGDAEVFVPAEGGEEIIQDEARVRDEL